MYRYFLLLNITRNTYYVIILSVNKLFRYRRGGLLALLKYLVNRIEMLYCGIIHFIIFNIKSLLFPKRF